MTLTRALWVARKEWKETVNAPMPYIVFSLFFLLTGWFFTGSLFLEGRASLDGFFGPQTLILSIFMPALTLRLFAEEFRSGTIETLGTLPLTDADIVAGKFAAALALWSVGVLLSLYYLVLLIVIGPPDVGQMAAGYMGLFLLGGFFTSLGLFGSSLTRSPVVAFLWGFLLCFSFYLVGPASNYVPGLTGQILSFLSVDRHFENFLKGVVDSRDVLFFVSGTGVALGGTWVRLRAWRNR